MKILILFLLMIPTVYAGWGDDGWGECGWGAECEEEAAPGGMYRLTCKEDEFKYINICVPDELYDLSLLVNESVFIQLVVII